MAQARIWLIENRAGVIQAVKEAAEPSGTEVIVWRRSVEAVRALSASDYEPPALLLMAEVPPDMSMVETVRSILEHDTAQGVPIVGISDELNCNMRDVSKVMGVAGWIRSPVDSEKLAVLLDCIETECLVARPVEREVNFDVKLGRLSIVWRNDALVCRGMMSHASDFARIKKVVPEGITDLKISWSELECVNIDGVNEWMTFLKSDFAKDKTITFMRCPLMMCEIIKLMPEAFGERVKIESVSIPLSSELRFELARTMEFGSSGVKKLIGDQLRYVFSVSGDWRELPFNEEMVNSLMELEHNGRFGLPLERYLAFFHTAQRHMLAEFFITRETILDQSSRIAARLKGVTDFLDLYSINLEFLPPDRTVMVRIIQGCYDPILAILVATERFLHTMRLKVEHGFSSDALMGRRFRPILDVMKAPVFVEVRELAKEIELEELEMEFEREPSKEVLEKLILATLKMVGCMMGTLKEIINELGVRVLDIIRAYSEVGDPVDQALNLLPIEGGSDIERVRARVEGLLDVDGTLLFEDLSKEVKKMGLGYRDELKRINQSLTSHDVMSQCCEHRIDEVETLTHLMDADEIATKIVGGAVTILEKRLVAFYYPDTEVCEAVTANMGEFKFF